jgi:hypothetical protein
MPSLLPVCDLAARPGYSDNARAGPDPLRVPIWAPFRLQFYCNGHNWLARRLTAEGIGYTMADNAFIRSRLQNPTDDVIFLANS